MTDDFLGSLQGVLQNEIEQQQSTDWGSILANALTQGAKGAAAGFAEAKPTDYGSQLAAALVGGLSSGYGQARQRNIRNDILGGLSSSIDATKAGQYQSLAEALKANELSNLANAVTTDNYNFDLGLDRQRQQNVMKNEIALDLERGKLPLQKELERYKTDQSIRQQNNLFGGTGTTSGNNVITPEAIAQDPNKPYSQKVVELSRYFQQTTRSTPNEALKQANNILKNQVLDSANLPESTKQIMDIIPQGLQKKAFEEVKLLQSEANTLATIDDIYSKMEDISTISALNPRSTEGAIFEAGQGAINLNVVEKYKGVMSENDYQRMKGLLPSKWDTKERLIEKKKLMKNMITQISNSGTPILSSFGINDFVQRKKTNPQAYLPNDNNQRNVETKTVGGKKYKKVQGGWQEVK